MPYDIYALYKLFGSSTHLPLQDVICQINLMHCTGSLGAAATAINEPMLPNGQPVTRQAEAKLSATAQFQMEAALQKDAFLVFRALCKLSVRASETATGTDMTAIRGKVSCQPLTSCYNHPQYCLQAAVPTSKESTAIL